MRATMSRYLLLATGLVAFTAMADGRSTQRSNVVVRDASGSVDLPRYFTSPSPVYQRGNQLSQSLPDNHPQVKSFLDFYSQQIGSQLPALTRAQLASFPARYLDIADNGGNASSGNFNSSLVCQSCHDSD